MSDQTSDLAPMPPKLLQVLSSEVKDTKEIISKSYALMLQRKVESREYYEPAEHLHESISKTRRQFQEKAEEALLLISQETEQLKQIQKVNEYSLQELRKSHEYLVNAPSEPNDSPINLAVRSIAAMFPFIAFAMLAYCTK